MASAAKASTGATSARPTAASTMSSRRFTIAARPAHGEKHLRRLEAGLIAPGPGPVTKCIERARVRIGPDLALVARHGGDLGLERLGDIHPRVGHEAARVGPLRAARGVERVHGSDAILRRSRRDEGGFEEQLVVAIDVATVLTIDHVGSQLADDLLER